MFFPLNLNCSCDGSGSDGCRPTRFVPTIPHLLPLLAGAHSRPVRKNHAAGAPLAQLMIDAGLAEAVERSIAHLLTNPQEVPHV